MHKSVLRLFILTMLVGSLSGCGIIDYFYLPPSEDTAQELFENGNDAMAEKDYVSAVEYFKPQSLRERHIWLLAEQLAPVSLKKQKNLGRK